MRIATLYEIRLINQGSLFPDWQKRVSAWMVQWTVSNNYQQYLLESQYDVGLALKGWRAKLLREVGAFDQLIPKWAVGAFDPAMAFEFHYRVTDDIKAGQPFYIDGGVATSVDVNRIDEHIANLTKRKNLVG